MSAITVKGTERDWTGPKENYLTHHEIIGWWCDGGEIEHPSAGLWYKTTSGRPNFNPEWEYRKKQREPRRGEVWVVDGHYCVYSNCMGVNSMNTQMKWLILQDCGTKCNADHRFKVYAAPSVESFYARKFYEQSMTKDAGFDYEDARKCMDVLKEACRYED